MNNSVFSIALNTSDVIAILSLIIAAFVAGWTYYRDMKDRAILKVLLRYKWLKIEDDETTSFLDVTNIGRRKTKIRIVGGDNFLTPFKKKTNIFCFKILKHIDNFLWIVKKENRNKKDRGYFINNFNFFNKDIHEGDSFIINIIDGIDSLVALKIKSIIVYDTIGNQFKVKDKEIVNMINKTLDEKEKSENLKV